MKQSGYYPKGWDKDALLAAFTARQPVVVGTLSATNGTAELDANDRTLIIQFDREMGEGMSFKPGPRGKEYFPLKKPAGFSADRKSFTLEMELQPHHEYEFVVTVMPRGFISKDGYLLQQDYPVRFKTK